MIGVTWLITDPSIASARLRGHVPRAVMESRGLVESGRDVVIASKHGWSVDLVRSACKRMVMDVCDDHFDSQKGYHYRQACKLADVVTCNSLTMRDIIKAKAGIDAVVIDDPYEDPELEPAEGEGVLWFGHQSNLPDLISLGDIGHPLKVISNGNYTPKSIDAALRKCRVTLIPTGVKIAKSANRAIRSIRYGKYPVCGPLLAHAELGLGEDDILHALDEAMKAPMRDRVMELQDIIRVRFSPEKVADDWYRVIEGLM